MATETEPIRQDIDSIRDSMTDKMEQIEMKVKGTVDSTVETVKRTFDIKEQVRERPWVALGTAVLAGYVLGSLGGSDSDEPRRDYRPGEAVQYYNRDDKAEREQARTTNGKTEYYAREQDRNQSPGFLDGIMDQFGDEIETVKTAAITAATTMLRDMIKQNLPQFSQSYEQARRERAQTNNSNSYDVGYTARPDTADALDRELQVPQAPGAPTGGGRDAFFRA